MKNKQPNKLYKVTFSRFFRHRVRERKAVMVFANDIDDAKVEARRMRPDCSKLSINEVMLIGGL